ncbi:hypothetical protein CRE_06064 [Caenorhabditis remanei]|uniref:Uncharacterized protein n=1 Tax=Caenorhabditis remanei TaxID=31234 RepID=E3NAZ5_CAERE|nr:hypothetical protein CRE_06064 [Caenorhabditis remanei]
MLVALFVNVICVGAALRPDILPSTSPPLDIDTELAKIADTCLSETDYEELCGNIVRYITAIGLSHVLVHESIASIALSELRALLGFSPLHPWQVYNRTKPSETELKNAPTPEAYYELREPRNQRRSLNSTHLFEKNVDAGIKYLDEHFPAIRTIFRQIFEEKLVGKGVLDKKLIDHMINVYFEALNRVDKATSDMLWYKLKCDGF